VVCEMCGANWYDTGPGSGTMEKDPNPSRKKQKTATVQATTLQAKSQQRGGGYKSRPGECARAGA